MILQRWKNGFPIEACNRDCTAFTRSPAFPWLCHWLRGDAADPRRDRRARRSASWQGPEVLSAGHATNCCEHNQHKSRWWTGRIRVAVSGSHRELGWQGWRDVRRLENSGHGKRTGDGTALDVHACLLERDGAERGRGFESRNAARMLLRGASSSGTKTGITLFHPDRFTSRRRAKPVGVYQPLTLLHYVITIVQPETLLKWHRQLVAKKEELRRTQAERSGLIDRSGKLKVNPPEKQRSSLLPTPTTKPNLQNPNAESQIIFQRN